MSCYFKSWSYFLFVHVPWFFLFLLWFLLLLLWLYAFEEMTLTYSCLFVDPTSRGCSCLLDVFILLCLDFYIWIIAAAYNFIKHVFPAEATPSDSDNDRADAAEEDTDEDENAFFDTRDFLSSSSFKSNGSDLRISSFSSDDDAFHAFESEEDIESSIKDAVANFPYVKRRKKLPDPKEKEKGVSLWSMIKDNIGKDLTKVCLPVYFNEPISSLQKCFEELEYSYLLDRAYAWGKQVTA